MDMNDNSDHKRHRRAGWVEASRILRSRDVKNEDVTHRAGLPSELS